MKRRRFVVIDVALNIAPVTSQKRDISQYAIEFARALDIERPKAGVEMVQTKVRAILDGAILTEMAGRWLID